MLAAQMVATHSLAMELLARAKHAEYVATTTDYGKLAVRLLRTYAIQLETLAKLHRKGEQTVRVEHVHVSPRAGEGNRRQCEWHGLIGVIDAKDARPCAANDNPTPGSSERPVTEQERGGAARACRLL